MKKLLFFLTISFGLIGVVLGQTNQYGISDAQGQDILALIRKYHLARGSLAYRSAVIPRMLAEANVFAERLKLPIQYPIQLADIKDGHVSPPWYSGLNLGFLNTNIASPIARIYAAKVTVMGAIETTNFAFAFNKGHLWDVVRLHDPAMNPENFGSLVGVPSLINDAQAYQMATQWLTAVSVDVPALEKKYKLNFFQWTFHDTNKLPIFDVKWGEGQMQFADATAAKVTILGTTKELMEMQIGDKAFSRRPQMVITNAFELCSIPDPPLKQLQSLPGVQTNSATFPR